VHSNAVESRIHGVRSASAGVRQRPDPHDQLRLTGYAVLTVLMWLVLPSVLARRCASLYRGACLTTAM